MRASLLAGIGVGSCVMMGAGGARAQHGGDIALDGFRPALDTQGYVTVDGAGLTPSGQVAFGLYTTWAHGLLRLDGGGASYRVRDVFSPTLVASFGVPRLPAALGVSLPFGVVAATRDDERTGDQGLGDLGLHAKIGLGRRAAIAASLWLPTATDDAWLGAGATSGQVRIVVEGRRGRVRGALNGGVRVRAGGAAAYMDTPEGLPATGRQIALGAALPVGGALAYGLSPGKLDALAEAWALVPLDGGGYAPVEALAGLKVHLAAASHFTIGGGVGLGPDNGNPDARVFLAIVFEPGPAGGTTVRIPDMPERPMIARVPDDPVQPPAAPLDRDGDGLLDDDDLCAEVAEDADGVEDDDGCPEDDADGDRIADVDDRCKLKPENVNGVADHDGCPDNDLITFTDGAFEILKPIHFEFDSAVIKEESFPVLGAVADALRTHRQIRRMEIGGHTDSRGSDTYNHALSQRRADAVRAYLIGAGIEPERIEAEGYGESRPLDLRRTQAAHDKNRRVEFLILD